MSNHSSTAVGILNAGAWGTAIAKILAEKGTSVHIWDYNADIIDDINNNHKNGRFLFGVDLPASIKASGDVREVAGNKDFLLVATPSMYLLPTIRQIGDVPGIKEGTTIIGILTKGFLPSPEGPLLITECLESILPDTCQGNLVYISGPSHAEEVARGKLTGLISASYSGRSTVKVRHLLTGSSLIVFASLDVIGVQVCAAVKNVIAIACGMFDALMELSEAFGDNTESLLIAAGLNEIQLIGQTLGATHPETFTSIAGVGDLDVTCRSKYGRNRRFGKEIILDRITQRYKNLDDLIENIDDIGYLPEGVMACKYVRQITGKYNLHLPISDAVYDILNNDVRPFEAVDDMLDRIRGKFRAH